MAKLNMCRECGRGVSKKAKVCPHCGERQPVKKSLLAWLLPIILIGLFMILPEIKYTGYTQIIKTSCEKTADYIKALRYFSSQNNNNPQEYEMDRRKTEEQLKKFKLNKCDNNLLINNSWNPLTDGTIKK
jgi:predicted nucleic acid-binding Zn ribbon protein